MLNLELGQPQSTVIDQSGATGASGQMIDIFWEHPFYSKVQQDKK